VSEPPFEEVSKETFREVYFRLGGGDRSGWTADHWRKFFEEEVQSGFRFVVQRPATPEHDRMWIVADYAAREYRLFFLTEASTESVFDHPGKD
jgi:hypothetical protein